jgi:radical SAM superfamily enzyme YgiQ (UPF0313 family)
MNNKILLVNPYLLERTYQGKAMGLDYLATQLLNLSFECKIFDFEIHTDFENVLKKYSPDIVGITSLSIQNDIANNIAKKVKEISEDIIVIKGGPHETFSYKYTQTFHHEYVDFSIIGEGEETIKDLCTSISNGTIESDKFKIKGISFYHNNKIVFTGHRDIALNIDNYIPTRLNFDASYNFDVFKFEKTAQVMTSRGCYSNCFFCTESSLSKFERHRSIESVEHELKLLKKEKYKAIYFDDSTFTRNRERTIEICNILRKYGFIWGCNTRVDCLDEQLIRLMKESGCVYCFCGIESATKEVLRGLNKTTSPKEYLADAENVYRWFRKYNLPVSVFLILGSAKLVNDIGTRRKYIHETIDDFKKSVTFAINRLNPDFLSLSVLRLLPGTPFASFDKFSFLSNLEYPIDGKYYDQKWYEKNNLADFRNKHHIFKAFEGRFSINSNITARQIYESLQFVFDIVNNNNLHRETPTHIVLNSTVFNEFVKLEEGKYQLSPFNEIPEI